MNVKVMIGEMAKFHGVSAQTLRYYDSIDLFKPLYLDETTGYRYYGIEQFGHLESILFLKGMEMSLKEIKQYFENRDLNSMIGLLEQKKEFIDDEISSLKKKKKIITAILNTVNTYLDKDIFGKFRVQKLPKREMLFFNFNSDDFFLEHEYGIKKLGMEIKDINDLYLNPFSSVIDQQDIQNENFTKFKGISLVFNENKRVKGTIPLPAGEFALVTYIGTYKDVLDYIKKLVKWIKENNYKITGDGLVLIITDKAYSDYEYEYISEIQIPVQKNEKSC